MRRGRRRPPAPWSSLTTPGRRPLNLTKVEGRDKCFILRNSVKCKNFILKHRNKDRHGHMSSFCVKKFSLCCSSYQHENYLYQQKSSAQTTLWFPNSNFQSKHVPLVILMFAKKIQSCDLLYNPQTQTYVRVAMKEDRDRDTHDIRCHMLCSTSCY